MTRESEDTRRPRWVYGVGTEPDPRFTFANERTFLAWIRTGLAFVTAGLAIATLAHFAPGAELRVKIAAAVLVTCGLLSGVTGYSRWARNERAMRLHRPLVATGAMPILTLALVVIAAIAGFALGG